LEDICLVLQRHSYKSSRPVWRHVVRIFKKITSCPPLPPLKTVTLEYIEDLKTHDFEQRNVHLHRAQMEELDGLLLTIPTLQRVVLKPPESEECSRFGEKDRMHIEEMLPGLKEKEVLVV
jgi:hypothetical protein